ncbi:MAG TPA: hypothetical protein VGF17_27530 [Phytomonospora sp.]
MKVIIGERTYDMRTSDELSLRHALAFNKECLDQGLGVSWLDIERLRAEVAALPAGEREQHPDVLMLTAVDVWATRVLAGDDVSFVDAISTPLSQMVFVSDPGDAPLPEQAPPDPRRARPGSGRADEPRPRKAGKSSRKRT